MNTTENPPPGDQGLVFQTHALQMILFGPFYVRTQHRYGSSRIESLHTRFIILDNFTLKLYNRLLEMTKELSRPTAYVNTQAFPTDDANCKDTICEKAQTISFVERGFEKLGLGHQAVGFPRCSYMVKFSSPLESFS